MIRNFKHVGKRTDPNSSQGGSCDYCGKNGFCCSASKHEINADCTDEMVIAIRNSDYAKESYHMCVAKRQEDSCYEWVIYKDFRCPGSLF